MKIENFEREKGPNTFPAFRSLTNQEADRVLSLLKRRLELPIEACPQDVLRAIDEKAIHLNGVDATRDDFDLRGLLRALNFSAHTVLMNWYRFDSVDEFNGEDLCKVFPNVFYPSADDVEIMDSDLTWILSIRHFGAAKALRFARLQAAGSPTLEASGLKARAQ